MSVSDWDLLQDYETDLEHRIEDARGEQLLGLKDPAWKENGGVVELRPRQEIVPAPRQTFVTSASATFYSPEWDSACRVLLERRGGV